MSTANPATASSAGGSDLSLRASRLRMSATPFLPSAQTLREKQTPSSSSASSTSTSLLSQFEASSSSTLSAAPGNSLFPTQARNPVAKTWPTISAGLEAAVADAMARIRARRAVPRPGGPVRHAFDPETAEPAEARIAVLRSRRDAYHAAIAAAQERVSALQYRHTHAQSSQAPGSETSEQDRALRAAMLSERVDEDVLHAAEARPHLEATVASLHDELDRERKILSEQREILQALEARAAESGIAADESTVSAASAGNDGGRPSVAPAGRAAVEAEVDRLQENFGTLIMDLVAFVERYFPEPKGGPRRPKKRGGKKPARKRRRKAAAGGGDSDDTSAAASDSDEDDSDLSDDRYHSLKRILELLMNACVDSPEFPHVRITDLFFEPYIELLVRCGVASKHPEDPGLLSLTEFHK